MKINLPRLSRTNLLRYKIKKPVVLWFLGFFCVSCGIELSYYYGVLQHIYNSDITKITSLICIIFAWQSSVCGISLWNVLQRNNHQDIGQKRVESGWLWSDVVLSLGMIGTVIGFMVMLTGFSGVDFSNTDAIQGLISQIGYGMSTSLSTTLVGLIASVILKLQFFTLERVIIDKRNIL